MGWSRELWMKSLGLPAAIPPPEETRDVKTMMQAARAKESRKPNQRKSRPQPRASKRARNVEEEGFPRVGEKVVVETLTLESKEVQEVIATPQESSAPSRGRRRRAVRGRFPPRRRSKSHPGPHRNPGGLGRALRSDPPRGSGAGSRAVGRACRGPLRGIGGRRLPDRRRGPVSARPLGRLGAQLSHSRRFLLGGGNRRLEERSPQRGRVERMH